MLGEGRVPVIHVFSYGFGNCDGRQLFRAGGGVSSRGDSVAFVAVVIPCFIY